MSHENKELTKKVLNALDPKYIFSQDREAKVTSVYKSFRDKEADKEKAVQALASAGLDRLSVFQRFGKSIGMNKESRERRATRRAQKAERDKKYLKNQAERASVSPEEAERRREVLMGISQPTTTLPTKENKVSLNQLEGVLSGPPKINTRKLPESRTILQRIGMNKESRDRRAQGARQTRELKDRFNRERLESDSEKKKKTRNPAVFRSLTYNSNPTYKGGNRTRKISSTSINSRQI